jgi:superfamily II DNA/RNA helicase
LKFKSGEANILVSTDVASRGLDIPGVSHVVNMNVPASPVEYVNRVDQASCSGKLKTCISFVTQFEILRLQSIEKLIGCTFVEHHVDEREAKKNVQQLRRLKRILQLVIVL